MTSGTKGEAKCKSEATPSKLEQLERREAALRHSALLLLVLLAAALALTSWQQIRELPLRLEALPIGLVVLVVLFGAYVWSKSREISELRGLVRGIEQRAAAPSEKQLDRLFALVANSQQGYRDLIDTFGDLLFALSLEGEIRAANRSFAELLGHPFNEFIGHRLDEFLDDPPGALRAAAEKALPRFLERRQWAGVIRVRLKEGPPDGSGQGVVCFLDCVLYAMIKGDRVVGLSGIARDVTQQRESEARFTETLQEGVYFTTPDGRVLDANPALVRMLGYDSKEELLGVHVDELYLDASQRALELHELERQGTVQGREVVLRRKNGNPAICLDTCTAIRDPLGRIIRYQGTFLDITQRREMEKRLHQEQEFARRLVDSFPDLIVVLDNMGRYTWVSPRIKEVLGYAPEELIGDALGERANPEDRPTLLGLYRELIAGKRTYASVEYRARNKQDEWRLLRASASPLFDAEGKIAGVIASARDVTEVKRLEQQLIQSEKLAAMGQMIAGVAHELNNPLTAILGVSELLRERTTDDTARRQLDLAHRQARRAANIVQNLLAFSRPTAPRKKPLDLNELLQRTLQLHEYSLRRNNVAVDFVPKPNLPCVVGDANQLIQVFLNLITNAEQAIREVRDSGTLRIRLDSADNAVQVSFQDDGSGIRPEALPRIFDPFFTTKRPGRGTGLGLSICMAIVKEHGGDIEAQTASDGGAVFTLSLPISGAQDTAAASQGPGVAQVEGASQPVSLLQGRSILVVDDEESIGELVQDGLSPRGLVVDRASTGEEALRLAAKRAYDAVLCDLNLAGPTGQAMSGREVIDRLSQSAGWQHGQKPFFIFMTGELANPAMLEILGRGSRVLQKPFRISELLSILVEGLEGTVPAELNRTTPGSS